MKKVWIRFLAVVLLACLLPVLLLGLGFLTPAQFTPSFTAELPDKVARLDSIREPKVIVVGGSSVAFGLDSALLEAAVGRPAVNFGLYASLGTKVMMDMSRKAIREGDIIVLMPEMNAQMYSLYFGAESLWYGLDGHFSLLSRIAWDNASDMLGGYWKFLTTKLRYLRTGADPVQPGSVYRHDAFNEYGDIAGVERDYNIMPAGFDTTLPITFSPDFVSEDFLDYVNEYVRYAEKRGATVYFGFSPMNLDAIAPETTLDDVYAFRDYLETRLDCPILGDPNTYIYNSGYFFDSNFHMNSSGVILHTRRIALDLAAALGEEMRCEIDVPKEPVKPSETEENEPYDENERFFTFEVRYGVRMISGVTDEGKKQTSLVTPKAVDGKRAVSIAADAFAGCDLLTDLVVTDNVASISDGAFRGASHLKRIHILSKNPDNTTVNGMDPTLPLLEGLPDGAFFYVPADALNAYSFNYFWAAYADYLKAE